MKYVKFNKTICGVDFLLNVLDINCQGLAEFPSETQSADFFQIFFIKQATGFLKLNDKIIKVQPNTIIFISKYQRHSWHVDFENLEGKILVFQDEFLNAFFSDQYFIFRLLYFYQTQHPLIISVSETYLDENISKLNEIKKELVAPQNDSVHLIRSLLYYTLIALNRHYSTINQLGNAIALDNTAYQFRKLVEQNLHSKQRIEDYTELMNISRISLNKAVKAQFYMTATDFIKSRLLFEIKMQLIHTAKTVAEISYEFEFAEANHLSRFFKQRTGQSPSEYRLAYQNGTS